MGTRAFQRARSRRGRLPESEPGWRLAERSSIADPPVFAESSNTPSAHDDSSVENVAAEIADRVVYSFADVAVDSASPPALAPQMKLRVSQPGDAHEREADQMADEIMRLPDPAPAEAAEAGGNAAAESTGTSGAQQAVPGDGGQPLDAATRAFMEPRFGHDFGHVRVHAHERAADAAAGFGARAYTVGSDIVFGAQEYSPGTTAGRHLLAHELTHIVQQGGEGSAPASGTVQRWPFSSPAPASDPASSSSPADPGYQETVHRPSIRVHIIAHASPRWRGAQDAADADRRNLELSRQRAETVRALVETLLARYLPAGTTVNVDIAVDEQEGTIGVTTEARGSRDTLKEAGGNRSDNAQERRRVDVVVDTTQLFEGEAGASRPLLKRPTASKFWHVSVDMSAGASIGAAGSLIVLTLTNDNSGQSMTGHVWAGGGGPKASIGAGASIWSDSTGFSTDEEVDFQDFDGVAVRYTTFGVSLFIGYSQSYISFMGLGSGAHSINVSGASTGTVGVGGSVVAGALSLDKPYPPTMIPIKDTDVTSVPYERTERGEDKLTVWFDTGSAKLGEAGEDSAHITDPEVAILDSFLASVVASTK